MNKLTFCIPILTMLACNYLMPAATPPPIPSVPGVPFCQPAQRINQDANGQIINLYRDGLLRVELDQNASTGYEWLVDRIESEMLADLGSDYRYDENSMPGSGGTQLLCFRAVGSGKTTLRLIYRQPWDLQVTPSVYENPDFEINIVIIQ